MDNKKTTKPIPNLDQFQGKTKMKTKRKTVGYKMCRECKFWITEKSDHCPDCGTLSPNFAPANEIKKSVFEVYKAVKQRLSPDIKCLRRIKETIEQRLKSLDLREKDIKTVLGNASQMENIKQALDAAIVAINNQRALYQIQLWDIEMVRLKNAVEGALSEWNNLPFVECKARLQLIHKAYKRASQLLSKWKSQEVLAKLPSGRNCISKMDLAIKDIEEVFWQALEISLKKHQIETFQSIWSKWNTSTVKDYEKALKEFTVEEDKEKEFLQEFSLKVHHFDELEVIRRLALLSKPKTCNTDLIHIVDNLITLPEMKEQQHSLETCKDKLFNISREHKSEALSNYLTHTFRQLNLLETLPVALCSTKSKNVQMLLRSELSTKKHERLQELQRDIKNEYKRIRESIIAKQAQVAIKGLTTMPTPDVQPSLEHTSFAIPEYFDTHEDVRDFSSAFEELEKEYAVLQLNQDAINKTA
jgi:hypothetical protein